MDSPLISFNFFKNCKILQYIGKEFDDFSNIRIKEEVCEPMDVSTSDINITVLIIFSFFSNFLNILIYTLSHSIRICF